MVMEEKKDIIFCDGLVKIYKTKEIEVMALSGLELAIRQGEMMAVIGKSGSGKSTFLNMVGGLERPSAGMLMVDGKNMSLLTEEELVKYKRDVVGFVWQNNSRNLFPYLDALDNVVTPMLFRKGNKAQKRERAEELLELVGMADRKNSTLRQLSGGEQQRVALARALANNPKVIIADEPTGNIDPKMSLEIMSLLVKINKLGKTVIVVTHEKNLVDYYKQRVVMLQDGLIVEDRVGGMFDEKI